MHIFYTLILHFFPYRKDTAKYYMNILKNITYPFMRAGKETVNKEGHNGSRILL